ncbi:MAG: hypothetical protein C0406_01855 [Sideroxydans sp.]|nr:hypothetical protein [Sideroxydans sp.]
MNLHARYSGFSLVEMSIVLVIVGLLLAGLLPTLSGQIENQRRTETTKQLNEIRDALFGFAIINGYLPCPTTTTNPSDTNYGIAPSSCTADPTSEGYIPWKTLGVTETDAWGIKRTTTTSSWIGYWRYRVDRSFAASGVTLSTTFSADQLAIKDSANNTITSTIERPIAIIYSTGPNLTVDGQNASFEGTSGIYQSDTTSPTFDDIAIWISRPQFFNRLVAAGKLP